MTDLQSSTTIGTGLVAPRIPFTTRLVTDAVLFGRQVLNTMVLPLLEQREEQPLELDFKLPFEDFENEFITDRLAQVRPEPGESREAPRVNLDEVSPAQLREMLLESPVILEGLATKLGVIDKWGLDALARDHKDVRLWITNADATEFKGSLGELIDEMMAGTDTGKYVRGAADIFLDNPELEQTLPFDLMREYIGELGSHFSTEMFIGGPGTGSSFHCAPFFNFFALIHGKKRWQFIHPSYSRWMYAFLHHTGFGISRVDHRLEPALVSERWPLYDHVPRLSAEIEAGDMLINPPWWWHSVDNLSQSSIGVATRWAEPKLTRFNRRFEFMSLLSPSAREVHRLARRAREGTRLNDAIWRQRFHLKPSDRLARWMK